MQPSFIKGHTYTDERGSLVFVNDFAMQEVKRFYTIFHHSTQVIRAWQGHRREQKWFAPLDGVFEVILVKPDNWQNPSPDLPLLHFELNAANPGVLHIPGGYASGFRSLVPNSKMIVYSDMNLEDSKQDDVRFDKSRWYTWEQ